MTPRCLLDNRGDDLTNWSSGGEDSRHTLLLQPGNVVRGDDPSGHNQHIVQPTSAKSLQHLGQENIVRPGEHRESHHVHVLLECGLGDGIRGLVQPRVDHLHACISEPPSDHLGSPVVTIQTGFGHQDTNTSIKFRSSHWLTR